MAHEFIVGRAVDFTTTVLRPAAAGDYETLRLMYSVDSDPADSCDRIKHHDETHKRVVRENAITLSRRPESIFH